jgi:DNA recombination protein RmuC
MIWALFGILIGAAAATPVVILLCSRKSQQLSGELRTSVALAEQRQVDLSQQLAGEKNVTQSLRDQLGVAQRDLASARMQFESAQQNLLQQRKLIDDAQVQLRQAFSSASSEVLARNNETFLQLAREQFGKISADANGSLDERKAQIEGMLKPMREVLDQYQLRVADIEKSRVESYSMLREQLGTLAETQRTLNTQTSQLVTALSRPAVRGQWGEISLRRLVELAGLTSRCDFVEQQSVDTDQGRQRPDMIVSLPNGRTVVIDCKTVLDAFLDAAATPNLDEQRAHLQRHAQQLRARARELSLKSYWSQFEQSPEFVVMFLPGESFLYAAVEHDPSLIEDCLNNGVIVATPTTLIALLKAIEFGWRQESIAENAEQIRTLGTDLYDRMGTVLGYIAKLGAGLDGAVKSYNQAVASLESRVVVTAKKMSELGARTDRPHAELSTIEQTPREISTTMFDSQS